MVLANGDACGYRNQPLRQQVMFMFLDRHGAVSVHVDCVVGGKKEFTLLNKSEMELLADAYEMANVMH
ncbi:hypothetical protein BEC97_25765 [Escherichia coli]|nr:hypothetical protein [Escherichia coli]